MKTRIIKQLIILVMLFQANAIAQSVAIAPIKTYGIYAGPKIVSSLTRLEFVKLNKYAVLDQFDMNEVAEPTQYDSCFGKSCLIEYGKKLGVNFIVSGSVDGLGNKIVVNLKMIDVEKEMVAMSKSMEFDNQESELQRMIGIVINDMHGIVNDPELVKRLAFKNEMITSNNVGRIKNSGPRMGIAYTVGSLEEFVTRPEDQGGLDIAPVVSNLGYQFEGQYVGTEKFSALFECLVMFTGLEQGQFIPSVSLLNGFRFGKSGWEFAFGPSFSLSKRSVGFFDKDNHYGLGSGRYWRESEYNQAGFTTNSLSENGYEFSKNLDKRGDLEFATRWILGFGRTFQSGALNVPVNLFYSSQKGGGMIGLSVGFNIIRAKKSIN